MVPANTRTLGQSAEQRACRFLCKQGLSLVTRNYRSRFGEIDLIMRDGDCLVFVEVRCRSANRLDSAALTVDTRKQRKLAKTASLFIATAPIYDGQTTRFDVVGIDLDTRGRASVDWVVDAFRC